MVGWLAGRPIAISSSSSSSSSGGSGIGRTSLQQKLSRLSSYDDMNMCVDFRRVLLSRLYCIRPLEISSTLGTVDVSAKVRGSGKSGQAQAIQHALAKALVKLNPDHRPGLRQAGLLTRDSRVVERKKPGLRKARKREQWKKR